MTLSLLSVPYSLISLWLWIYLMPLVRVRFYSFFPPLPPERFHLRRELFQRRNIKAATKRSVNFIFHSRDFTVSFCFQDEMVGLPEWKVKNKELEIIWIMLLLLFLSVCFLHGALLYDTFLSFSFNASPSALACKHVWKSFSLAALNKQRRAKLKTRINNGHLHAEDFTRYESLLHRCYRRCRL
jgi:hypothetical protein